MRYFITISEVAENDIREAYLWYEKQKESLGVTFKKHFISSINSIQDNPVKIQISYLDIRVCFLKKFPYGIHFNVTNNNILIVGVFHTSINPEKWIKR